MFKFGTGWISFESGRAITASTKSRTGMLKLWRRRMRTPLVASALLLTGCTPVSSDYGVPLAVGAVGAALWALTAFLDARSASAATLPRYDGDNAYDAGDAADSDGGDGD